MENELECLRADRKDREHLREELIRKAKILQAKAHSKRTQGEGRLVTWQGHSPAKVTRSLFCSLGFEKFRGDIFII